MKKFAVILAGCGVYDGAEIHEATLSMLAIAQQGASYALFAPDKPQHHVVNHLTGEVMPETRNVLVESARIARGQIRPLTQLSVGEFDALMLPGGFGVAKNLCTFAMEGDAMTLDPEVERVLKSAHTAGKPIGALCISPVMLARLFPGAMLTIGQDKGTATAVENMGARHMLTSHGEVTIDERNKLFTTPCYMLDARITDIADGASHIVRAMLDFMQ